MIYPYISNAWNEMTNTTAINNYKTIASKYSEEQVNEAFQDANNYNKQLSSLTNQFQDFKSLKNYNDILNVNGDGMMGYIRIPKINVKLAIYHGFANSILNTACGHLEGTSFPVGGPSTHAVISAHRGLPSAKLFSDLNKMEIGETFSIEVLNKILYYKVDQIKITGPTDTEDLQIIKDEDHVTLLTCTPYGINTHRLLVRGVRIANPWELGHAVKDEAFRLNPYLVCLFLALFILLILLVWTLTRYKRYRPVSNAELDELERQHIVEQIGEYKSEEREEQEVWKS